MCMHFSGLLILGVLEPWRVRHLSASGIIVRYLGGWWPLGQFMTHKCSGGRFTLVCCAGITKTPRRDSTPFLDCRVGDGHGGE